MIPKHTDFEKAQASLPFGMRFLNVGEPIISTDWIWYPRGGWKHGTALEGQCVTNGLFGRKADAEHAPHGYRLLQAGERMLPDDLVFDPSQSALGWRAHNSYAFPTCASKEQLFLSVCLPRARKRTPKPQPATASTGCEKMLRGIYKGSPCGEAAWQPPAGWRKLERHEDVAMGDYVHDSDETYQWRPVLDAKVVNHYRNMGAFPTSTYYRKVQPAAVPKWPAIFEYVGSDHKAHGELVLAKSEEGPVTIILSKVPYWPLASVYSRFDQNFNFPGGWNRRDDLRSFYIKLDN